MSYNYLNRFLQSKQGSDDNRLFMGGTLEFAGNNTPGYWQNGSFYAFNSNDSQKVTTFNQLLAATNNGENVINIDGAITFEGDIATNNDTYVFLSPSARLDMSTYSWDKRSNSLNIIGGGNNVITWASTNGNSPFIDTVGTFFKMSIENCLLGNVGNDPNTLICDPDIIPVRLKNCSVIDNGQANSGVVFADGGWADNVSFGTNVDFSTSEKIAQFKNGSWGSKIQLYNFGNSVNSLITIDAGATVEGLIGGNGNNIVTNNGVLYAAENSTAFSLGTIDLICNGNAQTLNSTIQNALIQGSNTTNIGNFYTGSFTINSGVIGTLIDGCIGAGGTYIDNGSDTVANANRGYFPNGGGGSISLSPYQAAIDNVGKLAYHYATFGAAYSVGKTENYSINNILETGNINFIPSGQLFAQIGATFTWDLGVYSIVGSLAPSITGANTLTIDFTDASSIFKWGNSTAGLPFSNLDKLSTVVINPKGGVLQNVSTTANCYLYCAGTFIITPGILLLPNASAGGIKTTAYTTIQGLELTGGGENCDTALICEGGSIRDVILDGTFANNSILIKSNVDTAIDVLNANIAINGTIEVMGKATKIFSTNPTGYLIVQAKTSLDPSGNTSISESNFDQLSLSSGTTRIKISDCTIKLLDIPLDNTTELDLVNVTVLNNSILSGNLNISNCRFVSGFQVNAGANVCISTSRSGSGISWAGATISRAANDSNVGND